MCQLQQCAGQLLLFCTALIKKTHTKKKTAWQDIFGINIQCMSGCMLRFNELWQVSLCSNMGSSGFWLVGPAKCGFIGIMWKETATVDSSCVTNPLNENLVSFGPVSLWQAWIHPNLPSTWGFPECTHHTRVWSQPASSPQWGASLVLICEVCQDLPSHNTAREWITPLRERTESSFVALEYCSTWSVCGGVLCWRCVFCA